MLAAGSNSAATNAHETVREMAGGDPSGRVLLLAAVAVALQYWVRSDDFEPG